MSALTLLDGGKDITGNTPFIPQTFSDNVGASFGDFMFRNRNMPAPFIIDKVQFDERNKQIQQSFAVDDPFDLIDTTEIDERYSNPTLQGRVNMLNEKQDLLDAYITEQRVNGDPRYNKIKTKSEMLEYTRNVARYARQELHETQNRSSTFDSAAGGLVGGIAGSFTDPVNLATLPMGVGASAGLLRAATSLSGPLVVPVAAKSVGVLKAMAIEGGLNAVIESTQVGATAKWQKELGFKYGIGEAATDVAFAGLGGAAFTGIIRGTGKAIRAVGSKSQRILDKAADRVSDEDVKSALQSGSRTAHIDETMPIERPFNKEDINVQRAAVAETQDALNNYRQPDLSIAEKHFNMRELDYRATGELSPDNVARIAKRPANSVALVEEGRFDSRKEADTFIKEEAAHFGEKRTDYIVQQDSDGKHTVLKARDDVRMEMDEAGEPLEYKSLTAAAKAASKIEDAQAITFKPIKGRAKQKHMVVVGKSLSRDDVAAIKKNPEFFNIVSRQKSVRPAQPDSANLKLADTPLYDTITSPKIDAEKLAERSDAMLDTKTQQAARADFDRMLEDDPDFTVTTDVDSPLTVKDIKELLDEQDQIIQAITVCGVG